MATNIKLVCFLTLVSSVFSQYYTNDNNVALEIGSRALESECTTSKDCQEDHSDCVDKKCQCITGYVLDSSLTKCLKVSTGYNDVCEDSVQCSKFLSAGGVCIKGKCACIDGYHYLKGTCHKSKGLGEACNKNEDCFVNAEYQATKCEENICKCNDGYYQREYSSCRPAVIREKDPCLIDADCRTFDDKAVCEKKVCTLKPSKKIKRSITENDDPSNNKVAEAEGSKDAETVKVGSSCDKNEDCKEIGNSLCGVDKVCICKRSYFPSAKKTECLAEIGNLCDENSKETKISKAQCKDSAWTCEYGLINLKSNQQCIQLSTFLNGDCEDDEACGIFGPKAKCINKECACDSKTTHFDSKERFCWVTRGNNEECKKDNDCVVKSGSPQTKCSQVCTCPEKTLPSDDKSYCVTKEAKLGVYCEVDKDCAAPQSKCSGKKCTCKDLFDIVGDKCVAGLNAPCTKDAECTLANMGCSEVEVDKKKVCTCKVDSVLKPNSRDCIKKSTFNGTCEYDVQCSSAVTNSFCNFNITNVPPTNSSTPIVKTTLETNFVITRKDKDEKGRCECIDNFYYADGTCYEKREIGQTCSREDQCFVEHASCKDNTCKCDDQYNQVDKECKPVNGAPGSHSSFFIIFATILMAFTTLY